MALVNTILPSPSFPSYVKDLLNQFFTLIETNSPEVSDTLADEVFTPTVTITAGPWKGLTHTGSEEIRRSRDTAWKAITSRRHKITKIYLGASPDNSTQMDIMLDGILKLGLINGKDLEMGFVQRCVVVDAESDNPRLGFVQVWAVSFTFSGELLEA
jgi:hypothetical protein